VTQVSDKIAPAQVWHNKNTGDRLTVLHVTDTHVLVQSDNGLGRMEIEEFTTYFKKAS
jgi:hypothetical protein